MRQHDGFTAREGPVRVTRELRHYLTMGRGMGTLRGSFPDTPSPTTMPPDTGRARTHSKGR